MSMRETTSGMGGGTATEIDLIMAEARAGVATVTPQLAALLRGVPNAAERAVGKWTVAEVAAHVSHVCAGELMSASTAGAEPGPAVGDAHISGIGRFNADNLDADPERDLSVLAARIEERVADLLTATHHLRGDEIVTWLGGMRLPVSMILCHFLGELVVHGFDVARASGQSWNIEPQHAALGFGFLLGFLQSLDPEQRASFVDPDAVARFRARYEIKVRGGRRWFLEFDDGVMSMPVAPSGPIDCHISGDPIALLLVGFGRIGPLRPALTGRMVAWGRRPHFAFRFARLLRSP